MGLPGNRQNDGVVLRPTCPITAAGSNGTLPCEWYAFAMAQAQIDELFAQTLTGDYDDDAQWQAVAKLRKLGTRPVYERAAEWCISSDPLKRARGADVLAQIGRTIEHPQNNFPEESYSVVSQLALHEKDPLPLSSAIHALGHIGNFHALPLMVQNCSHEDDKVRFAVACALGNFADDPRAVRALIVLMEDRDEDVRDWATFGLGVLGHADSPEIRVALLKRTNDPNPNVRGEALAGLANRGESQAIPPLVAELNQGTVSDPLREAAESFLGESEQHEKWDGHDFAKALKLRFPL
jgi:HEAT repeat protein